MLFGIISFLSNKLPLDKSLLTYNDTWDKIDAMLAKIMSKDYSDEMLDSNGNGWV